MPTQIDIENFIMPAVQRYEEVFNCEVIYNVLILDECFERVEDTLKKNFDSSSAPYGYEPSQYKTAGVYCFWIRKLKPFRSENSDDDFRFINEAIAFILALLFVFEYNFDKRKPLPAITASYFHDIIKSLRYNSHSPNSTAFIFESLCTASVIKEL